MPSEEHEPPKPIPQAPACPLAAIPPPGPAPRDPGRAGLGRSRPSGCVFRILRGTRGARQGPLPWLALPEGGAAGPRARLSWRPRSPLQRLGRRGGLTRGSQPRWKGLLGVLSQRATKGLRGPRVRSGFSLMLLGVVSPQTQLRFKKVG